MNISIQMMCGFQDNLSRKVSVHLKNNAEVLLNDMRYMLGSRVTDKWIWNTAFMIFSFTVIVSSYNILAMHWSLCFELFL